MIHLWWNDVSAECAEPDVAEVYAAEALGGEVVFTVFRFTDDEWMAVARTGERPAVARAAHDLKDAQAACERYVEQRCC
jgi:hypothetical protein